MTSNLTTQDDQLPAGFEGGPSRAWAGQKMETGAEGIEGGYGILTYKGRTWKLRYKGQDYPIIYGKTAGAAAGQARGDIEVVFVRASIYKAKTYYPSYKEGSRDKPICWSNDGRTPDIAVPPSQVQSKGCAACPKNQPGSRVKPDGKPGIACADHKRTAVMLDPKLATDAIGMPLSEPLLLRIPAASLSDFGTFAQKMDHAKFPLATFITKVSFDPKVAYPKLVYTGIRKLDDAESEVSRALRDSPLAFRIVADGSEETTIGGPSADPEDANRAAPTPPFTGGLGGVGVAQPGGEKGRMVADAVANDNTAKNTVAVKSSDAELDAKVSDLMNR